MLIVKGESNSLVNTTTKKTPQPHLFSPRYTRIYRYKKKPKAGLEPATLRLSIYKSHTLYQLSYPGCYWSFPSSYSVKINSSAPFSVGTTSSTGIYIFLSFLFFCFFGTVTYKEVGQKKTPSLSAYFLLKSICIYERLAPCTRP